MGERASWREKGTNGNADNAGNVRNTYIADNTDNVGIDTNVNIIAIASIVSNADKENNQGIKSHRSLHAPLRALHVPQEARRGPDR